MKLLRSTLSMLLTKEKEVRAVILNIDPITGDLIAQVNNERAIIALAIGMNSLIFSAS